MKNCVMILSRGSDSWTGIVEMMESARGGTVVFEFSSPSPSHVIREIRSFLSKNKELRVVRMLRNGNPKWLGFYSAPVNLNIG